MAVSGDTGMRACCLAYAESPEAFIGEVRLLGALPARPGQVSVFRVCVAARALAKAEVEFGRLTQAHCHGDPDSGTVTVSEALSRQAWRWRRVVLGNSIANPCHPALPCFPYV